MGAVLRVCTVAGMCWACTVAIAAPVEWTGTIEERLAAHRAVEQVYWLNRIWPDANPGPKPPLEAVLSESELRSRVDDGLRKIHALEVLYDRRITTEEIQREIDRMARASKLPERLAEIWRALDEDPSRVAECLVRPRLAERLLRAYREVDAGTDGISFDVWWRAEKDRFAPRLPEPATGLQLPLLEVACTPGTWTDMNAGYPAPRRYHVAVWTGSEMFVWGGGEITYLSDGWRYDPATDNWNRVADAGAPAPRVNAHAFWTGTKVVVLGGYVQGTSGFPAGGLYDPATDSWSPTTAPVGASARQSETAVWTGSSVIVWGGREENGTKVASGLRYHVATDSWSATSSANAPAAREDHVAVWTGSHMVVWGGVVADDTTTNTGGRYELGTDSWTAITLNGAPSPRSHSSVVWTGTLMVVWGGQEVLHSFRDGGRYDPAQDAWSGVTSTGAPASRYDAPAVWTGTEMILWGGAAWDSDGYGQAGGRYRPSTNTWVPMASSGAPARIMDHTLVWTGDEMVLWGGGGPDASYSDRGYRYDAASNAWTPSSGGGRPRGRYEHTQIWTGSEMFVWGGSVDTEVNPERGYGALYDPALDLWTVVSSTGEPLNRRYHSSVWTGTEVIVWGGADSAGAPFGDGGRYDPATDAWTLIAPSPQVSARREHVGVWTGQRMVVWGGANADVVLGDGGVYDPATALWSPMSATGAPSPRSDHRAVWTGRHVVVWGGSDPTTYHSTGGRYDPAGDTWTDTSADPALDRRQEHRSIWSGREMIVHDGHVWGSPKAPGWVYDPLEDSWRAVASGGPPDGSYWSPRPTAWGCDRMYVFGDLADPNGAYDPRRNVWSAVPKSPTLLPRDVAGVVAAGTQFLLWGGAREGGGSSTATGAAYCACATAPLRASVWLRVGAPGNGGHLEWVVSEPATSYDVVRGSLSVLRSSAGDFTTATQSCLADDQPFVGLDDPQAPAVGDGFWYLVRARAGTTVGSWDDGAPSQVGLRDAEIAASPGACP